jgi:UDP-N-acetylglucosamine diphosphorylase / glucose-1-phosphate thymidylyltransferase / UDP-N-acetylgalactosamine diphosphorylase / glucosamine-1-phosphate N-acetyltransferase / galactosamine-1-phosphate N-acetyltransferase
MISVDQFIRGFSKIFIDQKDMMPWEVTTNLPIILSKLISNLSDEYDINGDVAIHRSSVVEAGVIFKAPVIVCKNCFVGANAYLRGGVFLDENVSVGPGCEIKSSVILSDSAVAHFNFIGDSLIGRNVNFEAGSIVANHHNDQSDKAIIVKIDSTIIKTGVTKFGAVVGDQSKIGANAVLSPGTVLKPNTIVKRLELINQID